MGIVFIGIFVVGIGSTGLYSFGVPFLDDNAGKEDSPMALGYAMTSRIVGPTIGYALGAIMLSIFVYPNEKPQGLQYVYFVYIYHISKIVQLEHRVILIKHFLQV